MLYLIIGATTTLIDEDRASALIKTSSRRWVIRSIGDTVYMIARW